MQTREQLLQQIEALRTQVTQLEADIARFTAYQAGPESERAKDPRRSRLDRLLEYHVGHWPLAVIEWDQNSRVCRWSNQAEDIFGWKREEVLGKHWDEIGLVHPADSEHVNLVGEQLIEGVSDFNTSSNRNYRKCGAVVHCEWFNSALRDENGKFLSFLSLVHDVSDAKRAERLLRQVMDLVPHEIFAKDRDGNFVVSNRTHAANYGMSPGEVVGRNERDITPKLDEAEKFLRDDQRIIESGKPKFIPEEVYTDPEGIVHYLQTSKVPFHIDDQDVRGVLGVAVDISDRKRSEEILRSSEHRNRVVLENVPDHILIHDRDGVVRYVNHPMSGFRRAEIIGRPARDFARAEFRESIDEALRHVIATRSNWEGEFTDIHGRRFTTLWSPLETSDGEVKSILSVTTDVTDQRAAEAALRFVAEGTARATGRSFFTAVVRHLAKALEFRYVLLARIDNELAKATTIAVCADGELVGNMEYDLRGTPCENVSQQAICFHPERVQELFPEDKFLVEMGIESYIGIPLISSTGATLGSLAALDVHPMHDRAELRSTLQIFAARAAVELERSVAEQRLRDSESRFRLMATHAPVGIATINAAGDATNVNPEFSRIVGRDAADCFGRGWIQGLHPEDRRRAADQWEKVVATGGSIESNQRFQLADGEVRWTQVRAHPRRSEGQVDGWICMILDVTEQHDAQTKLDEQQAMLAHAARLSTMGEMVAGIAHEINQPLSAISNYASACRNTREALGAVKDSSIESWLHEISDEAVRCGDIIRGLRNFAKKDDDAWAFVDLFEVVRESITLVQSESRSPAAAIDCQLPERGPRVCGNRVQLQQVIVNLLRNAREATHLCGHPRIRVEADISDSHARLSVSDNGPGVDDQKRLFDAFYSTKPDGLGMGLAISQSIIKSHLGRLRLEQQKGSGAIFHIELPLRSDACESREE